MGFLGVYGHVNVDYILHVPSLPGPDQTVAVAKEEVRLGGTGGNIARCAASLGVPTGLASCIGDDFPSYLEDQLRASPIDLIDLRRVAGPTPKVWIMTSPEGKQSAVIDQGVMGDSSTRPRLDYTMLNSDWVHFTTGPVQEHLAMAEEAARIGKRVGFDPAQELEYRYPGRVFERFLDQSDVFFANQAELARALEKLGYADPAQLLDHTEAVVVTQGSQGVRLWTEKERVSVPPCPVQGEAPRDSTGAGDAFRGGFYAGLHARQGFEEAIRWGAVAATLFLERGGQAFPTLEALRARRQEWRA